MNDKEIRLSEDEDVEQAKAWWERNKTSIVSGVAVGLVIMSGYNYWAVQKSQQALAASSLYETMVTEASVEGQAEATTAINDDFGGSVYAQLALLRQAKQQAEDDQAAAAEQTLRLVMASEEDLGIAAIAALRLAGLLVDQQQTDAAITVLNSELLANKQYAARVNELKGDALLKADSREEAKLAYAKSIEILGEQGQSTALLQLKSENIKP